jgi:hypothetical protein
MLYGDQKLGMLLSPSVESCTRDADGGRNLSFALALRAELNDELAERRVVFTRPPDFLGAGRRAARLSFLALVGAPRGFRFFAPFLRPAPLRLPPRAIVDCPFDCLPTSQLDSCTDGCGVHDRIIVSSPK